MLDEKDLQALAAMLQGMETRIDQKMGAMETRIDQKMEKQKQDIMHDVKILLDTEVTTRFNLLAEGQEDILRRMPDEDDMDIVDERLSTPEAMVKKLNREVAQLKKAQ